MRRSEFAWSRAEALRFLADQPVVHLASSLDDGEPVFRSVHGVIVDDWLCFHSSPKGEKTGLLGRPAVLAAEETVAVVPSTFFDPERACPATTYYRSVQVHGTLVAIDEPARKARALQALMEKLQPQGGHVPIDEAHPYYRAPVRGLLIAGVPLDRVDGKAKLAQNRGPDERAALLTSLWRRGDPGDTRAIELIRGANPDTPVPPFLSGPAGATMHGWLDDGAAPEAAALLDGQYWNDLFSPDELARAQRGSEAWVGARDADGSLIATARSLSDGAKNAWIYDVCVRADWRGRGLGKAVVALLLDHPRLRGARRVALGTRDAQGLYASLGFVPRERLPPRPYTSTEMILERPAARVSLPLAPGRVPALTGPVNRTLSLFLLLGPLAIAGCVERSKPGEGAARLSVYVLDAPPPVIPHGTPLVFGEKIRLLGYKIEPEGVIKPGADFKLTMYWQCDERLDGDWQLFTHLLDAQGNRLPGGHLDNVGPLRDASSGRQALPPADWRKGKIYVDEQPLRMPSEAPPEVAVAVGLWRDDQRLKVAPADPQNRGIVARIPTGAAPSPAPAPARREPPSLRVGKLTGAPPVIDGKLNDEVWRAAPTTGPLIDVSTGGPNQRFPVDGAARIAWDNQHLYLAFEVTDRKLIGNLKPGERDQRLWENECIEIMIDPDGDGDNTDYYEIQISTQNLIFDSQFDGYNLPRGGPNGPFGHQDWSLKGKTAVAVQGTLDRDDDEDQGYTVEAAIEWSSFSKAKRLPPANNDRWRFNFYAMKRNSGVAWSPILGEGNFHKASRFGRVTFTDLAP